MKEAKEILKDLSLEIELKNEKSNDLEDENIIESEIVIKDQLPKPGIKIKQNNRIIIEI
ncbi:MAG: hypothetical protein J6O41_04690 [Clostridia bacterium]|nr:hypothetical protein [Clostridia bacterium]